MEDLIDFVSEITRLPLPEAQDAAAATLDYITPRLSPLLKSSIEVLLQYPNLSEVEKDLLIAGRVLFPTDKSPKDEPLRFHD